MNTELERLVFVTRMMRVLHVDEYDGIRLSPHPLRWTPEAEAEQLDKVLRILESSRG